MREFVEREAAIHAVVKRFWSKQYVSDVELADAIEELSAADVVAREDLWRVQVAYDKVGQALDAANKFYMQGYNDAKADHNLVERKRGYWMDTREFCGDYMCSNCDALYGTNKFNFCPECGADMRGRANVSN